MTFESANRALSDKELTDRYCLEDFIDQSDLNEFLIYLREEDSYLCEMATLRGNNVVTDKLPFSFYISDKQAVHGAHAIRAKICWNPAKVSSSFDGYMYIHSNYDYISGSHKYKPTAKELQIARDFFKKYKVLFSAVWECKMQALDLADFFEGRLSFRQLLSKIETSEDPEDMNYYNINHCHSIEELEALVRRDNIWNMS